MMDDPIAMTRDEADSLLRKALIEHARAYGLLESDELLSDYAVVAHWQRVEDDDRSRYTTVYSRPQVPTHVAVGLFRTGERLADGGL